MKGLGRLVAWTLLLASLAVLAWQGWLFARIVHWRDHNPDQTRFMALGLAALRQSQPDARLRHRWVAYDDISIHLRRAVVAAEDDRFMQHRGFDWDGIQRALERNQAHGRPRAGGSTITQQLAKNLFLSPERSYLRKLQEALIALMLEAAWDKRRILEVYLNVVEWGEGIFGIGAAARYYYGQDAHRLGPAQAARLAVMLPSPRRYQRQFGPAQRAHAAGVLARMHQSQIP